MRRLARVLALCALAPLAAPAVPPAMACSGANVALAFGVYDPFSGTVLDGQGSLVVTCTRSGGPGNVTILVQLGPSQTSGTVANRQMAGPSGDRLNYNVYQDATRTVLWGDTSGSNTLSQNLTVPNNSSASSTFTIFGRIFANQDLRLGFYNDSLLITVNY